MIKQPGWPTSLACLALVLAVALLLHADLSQAKWVENMTAQGSPPPARDASSATGYVLGQRHFLGTRERGETYRWIAATQEWVAGTTENSSVYRGDNAPSGRPRLLPKLYTLWLAAVSWAIHAVTGEPLALSVERAALWEPVIAHLIGFAAAVAFMWRRYGAAAASVTGLCFALFVPLAGQFLPGVLSVRPWALVLSAYAVALCVPAPNRKNAILSKRAAFAAGLALWLDPAFGFPVVLISAAAAFAAAVSRDTTLRAIPWSLVGAAIVVAGWLIDRNPWNPAAGELRYVHPLYALAWLGVGVAFDAWQRMRTAPRRRTWAIVAMGAALLVTPLIYVQLTTGYLGWLYPSGALRRLTSLNETLVYGNALDWFGRASLAEIGFTLLPVGAAAVAMVFAWRKRHSTETESRAARLVATVVVIAVLALSVGRLRWLVVAGLVALPVIWNFARGLSSGARRGVTIGFSVFLFASLVAGKALPDSLRRPSAAQALSAGELEELIHRHLSHWVASHHPPQSVVALAPPQLADSLVFHGGNRVMMSTAWESYPGQLAASRILSAPEATEVEAVLQSSEITHLVVPSWDTVLPLLVREPQDEGKDTFHARLQRWVLPPYLRAIPYHLPRLPGFAGQVAVFKVVAPQDEALVLSRLAEYFVEMDRGEPAGLLADVLATSFPDDPNAAMARALVHAHAKRSAAFEREAARLADDVASKHTSLAWDRRVQRAIVLALARRHAPARPEIEACLAEATEELLYTLTPLEIFRLRTLAASYGHAFPDSRLDQLAASLSAEYKPAAN